MRKSVLLLLCYCAAAQTTYTQSTSQPPRSSDWATVRALTAGTELHVTTRTTVACTVESVSDEALVCSSQLAVTSIPRSQVRRVVLDAKTYRHPPVPNSDDRLGRHLAWYAVAGAGLGLAGAAGAGGSGGSKGVTLSLAGSGAAIGAVVALVGHAQRSAKGQVIYTAP